MNKTKVIYSAHNPNKEGVTHVAIQAMENPPYVFGTYSVRWESDLPKLPKDVPIMSIRAARSLFDFEQGKLEEISRE